MIHLATQNAVAEALFDEDDRRHRARTRRVTRANFSNLRGSDRDHYLDRAGLALDNDAKSPKWERDIAREIATGKEPK